MIEVLEKVAYICGSLVRGLRTDEMCAVDKFEQLGQHFSTRADRESLACGLEILAEDCPNELIVAEEQENARVIPADCTVFDPLDGTTNFFNGLDEFGITLCTLRAGVPVCSATYFPVRGELISAVRGEGCWVGGFENGRKIRRILWHGDLDKTQLGTDIGSWTRRQGVFEAVLKPLSWRFNILSAMSAVEGGRRVLCGNTAAYYNLGIAKVWDAAAMSLAVEEAGGVACDPKGNPLGFNKLECDWVWAVNKQLADIVVEHSSNWLGREVPRK